MAAARILEGCILGKSPDLAVFESGPLIPASVGEVRDAFYLCVLGCWGGLIRLLCRGKRTRPNIVVGGCEVVDLRAHQNQTWWSTDAQVPKP